jgi:hypothetical protein
MMAENAEDKLNDLVARVGKVRRWLVTLAILRITALCLIFVSVFTGLYAWLDNRLNFDEIARIVAFVLLIAGLAVLLRRLTKLLLSHISCSAAANYIEDKRSFNQQLVTTIEYYENKQNYPYSKALAEQLVLKVDKECEEFRFDSVVEKWQGCAFGAVILFGLIAASFYVRDNYVYFSSYFARLISPLASVEPISSTQLESITGDMVAEPDTEVKFEAEISGHVPESGKLVLAELTPETTDTDREQQFQEMQIQPCSIEGAKTRFQATKSFSKPGKFRYRFETDTTTTEWHELNISSVPEIESITANVTVPRRQPSRKWVKPYTEQVQSNTLEVIQGSSVTLSVKATDKLSKIIATGPDGKTITRQLDGVEEFDFYFNADKNGTAKFSLVSEDGLTNNNIPELQVIVKIDEPPKFKLLSPDGDYLATDVASVPVTFEVTDDFGLDSVKMFLEIPGRQPKEIVAPVEEGIKNIELTHTIELEQYDLSVGDSVLLYAEAVDIDTGSEPSNHTSSSDIYFIEIRPYRQNWVPMPGGKPSQGTGAPPEELLNILDYTRAILKKTWAIASKTELAEQDRSRLGFINQDVQYCAEQVALIRDDSQYDFQEPHKAVLNEVIRYFKQVSGYLTAYDAVASISPEKSAYRILRKFIIELELNWSPPSGGQGQQPQKPDNVKLQEKPELEGYEKERVEAQLKKMQQKLDKLTREQGQLQWSFENFLEQQTKKKPEQQSFDSKVSANEVEKQNQDANNDRQQNDSAGQKYKSTSGNQDTSSSQNNAQKDDSPAKSQSSGKGSGSSGTSDEKQNDADNQENVQALSPEQNESTQEDKSISNSKDETGKQGSSEKNKSTEDNTGTSNTSDGKQSDITNQQNSQNQSSGKVTSTNEGGIDAQRHGGRQNGSANFEARLRMLQAKQQVLREQVSQLKQELQQLPEGPEGGNNRVESQEHLSEAATRMEEFQNEMAEARFRAEISEKKSNRAVALMDTAKNELDMANKSLGHELILSDDEKLAQEAQDMAEQLAEDADALAESVTDVERQEMLDRLEAAKRLLELMPEPQWSTVDKGSSSSSGASHVLTKNPNITSAEMAKQMARRFWSIAINAKKQRQQLLENEPSDVEFYGQENEFFENAARYNQRTVEK